MDGIVIEIFNNHRSLKTGELREPGNYEFSLHTDYGITWREKDRWVVDMNGNAINKDVLRHELWHIHTYKNSNALLRNDVIRTLSFAWFFDEWGATNYAVSKH